MPVSLIPKKKIQKSGIKFIVNLVKENRQVALAAGIFILVIVVYGGFSGYTEVLSRELKQIRNQEKIIQDKRQIKKEDEVVRFSSRLASIEILLDDRLHSGKLFDFIGEITHPKVQFTDFIFKKDGGSVNITGATQGYVSFGEQVNSLKKNEQIEDLKVSNISVDRTGRVIFDMSFTVSEELYIYTN